MFRPLNKKILLIPLHEDKTNTTIFMGNSSTKKYEVVSIGKEVVEVKVKDHVYLNESKLIRLDINNTIYYLLEEEDIYMIVEE